MLQKYSINPNAKKSIGIDPGFGSSNFAIVCTQLVDAKIQIIHAEEYDRDEAGFSEMIEEVWRLKQRCGPKLYSSYLTEYKKPKPAGTTQRIL
jgi:hypothetical protein